MTIHSHDTTTFRRSVRHRLYERKKRAEGEREREGEKREKRKRIKQFSEETMNCVWTDVLVHRENSEMFLTFLFPLIAHGCVVHFVNQMRIVFLFIPVNTLVHNLRLVLLDWLKRAVEFISLIVFSSCSKTEKAKNLQRRNRALTRSLFMSHETP